MPPAANPALSGRRHCPRCKRPFGSRIRCLVLDHPCADDEALTVNDAAVGCMKRTKLAEGAVRLLAEHPRKSLAGPGGPEVCHYVTVDTERIPDFLSALQMAAAWRRHFKPFPGFSVPGGGCRLDGGSGPEVGVDARNPEVAAGGPHRQRRVRRNVEAARIAVASLQC